MYLRIVGRQPAVDQLIDRAVAYLGYAMKSLNQPAQNNNLRLPLSRLACDVLEEWKKEQNSDSQYVFPSPQKPGKPIVSVKRAWRTALKKSWRAVFPDLQSTPRILHASQLGRSRCRGATGDAAQQSRDEASLPTRNG